MATYFTKAPSLQIFRPDSEELMDNAQCWVCLGGKLLPVGVVCPCCDSEGFSMDARSHNYAFRLSVALDARRDHETWSTDGGYSHQPVIGPGE